MSSFPWLTVAAVIPLAGALVVALVPGGPAPARQGRDELAKRLALGFCLATLAVTIAMAARFDPAGAAFQFTENYRWIPQFGVSYAVGADGIALVLILLTAALMPAVILASWQDAGGGSSPAGAARPGRGVKTYLALTLVQETLLIGVFAATDLFLFYVMFEAMLVPMYFMIGGYGVGRRQYAAVKFLLYSLAGGLLMLAAVIALYVYSARGGHPGTFAFTRLEHVALSPDTSKWLFLGFFIAFAIKAPVWPFHTWLPDAAGAAQPGAAVAMVGVMDKAGTFGMIRYCLGLFPTAARYFIPLILALAVISVLYAAVAAIGQADLKRLIGYTSVSHAGLITLGIFALTSQSQAGAALSMVNTGFAAAALFLITGFMIARRGSPRMDGYGGVAQAAPVLAGLFLIAGLAGMALPGLSTFVSEFLVLVGAFTRYPLAAVLATLGIILAAIYILWMYQRTMTGPAREQIAGMPDLKPRELWAAGPVIAVIIALGVYPKPALDIISPAVRQTMIQLHATDPLPPHPPSAQVRATAPGRRP